MKQAPIGHKFGTKVHEQLEAFVAINMARLIHEGFAQQSTAPRGDGYNYVGQISNFGTGSLDGRFDFDAVAKHVMEGLRLSQPQQEVFPDAVQGSERSAVDS